MLSPRSVAQTSDLDGGDARALNARGMRALQERDFEAARICFAGAADADPKEPVLRTNLAAACRALGDDPGEQQALEAALSLDRLNFTAQLRLAELHTRLGRKVEAAQGWSNVVQMAQGIEPPSAAVVEALRRGRAYLAEHNAALSEALEAALGEDVEALGAAARRFSACVDAALGRRRIYHNECHGLHYPFLPADEFFERERFPWLADLEARTGAIRAEALRLLESRPAALRPYVRQDAGTPQNKWSALDNSLDWSACFLWEYGERNDEVCSLCPETAAALEAVPQNRIPGKAPTAFFSIL
jgi:tetratricopeptide (TPR) repeat protein